MSPHGGSGSCGTASSAATPSQDWPAKAANAWLAVLFAFLLILTGLFLAWYYRNLLVKKEKPTYAPTAPPAASYPPVSYYQPSYYSYPGAQSYAYPQYGYGAGQYGSGYGQSAGGYNPYGGYAAPVAAPAVPKPPDPPAAPSPSGPSGPSKNCTACGRAVPVEANFCPFGRQRL